ncbi:MAG: MFS transporter [Bdellovibrionota bacterium]
MIKHPPGFWHLLWVQFVGAFNDNVWKILVTLLLIAYAKTQSGDTLLAAQYYSTLVFVVFTLPFVLFSLPAGVLSDQIDRKKVIVWTKAVEMSILALGWISLLYQGWIFFPLIVLALLSIQSAFFGPAKYAILTDLLEPKNLPSGNAHLQTWTLLAIIMGSAAGGYLLDIMTDHKAWIALFLLILSASSFWSSLHIHRSFSSSSPNVVATAHSMKLLKDAAKESLSSPLLRTAILSLSFCWLLISQASQNILVYAKIYLSLTDSLAALPMAVFGVGVGIGSFVVSTVAQDRKMFQMSLLGISGFFLVHLALSFHPNYSILLVLAGMFGMCNGFWMTPLQVYLQKYSSTERRATVLGIANWIGFIGIFLGSILVSASAYLSMTISQTFQVFAGLILAHLVWMIFERKNISL